MKTHKKIKTIKRTIPIIKSYNSDQKTFFPQIDKQNNFVPFRFCTKEEEESQRNKTTFKGKVNTVTRLRRWKKSGPTLFLSQVWKLVRKNEDEPFNWVISSLRVCINLLVCLKFSRQVFSPIVLKTTKRISACIWDDR